MSPAIVGFARKTPRRQPPPEATATRMPSRESPAHDWKKFVVTSKVKSILDAHLQPCPTSENVEREFCRAADAATRPFAAPEGWTPAKGALVRLRPGLDEKEGLRAGEVAVVMYVNRDGESFDVKRLRDGKPEGDEMYDIPAADLVHGFEGMLPLQAAAALALSAVNVVGGFRVAQRMLDLFKRPDDAPEFYELYAAPVALALAGVGVAARQGPSSFEGARAYAPPARGASAAAVAGRMGWEAWPRRRSVGAAHKSSSGRCSQSGVQERK